MNAFKHMHLASFIGSVGSFALGTAVVTAALLGSESVARADDTGSSTSTTAPAVTPSQPASPAAPAASTEEEDPFKPVALTLNPLSLAIGRYGFNVEYLPATHHGFMLNPFVSITSAESNGDESSYTTFGGELGYHFYTGTRGANGFFIGPSFVLWQTSGDIKTAAHGSSPATEVKTSFSTYGVALDLGGQHVTKSGFTIGAGVGAMYLTGSAGASSGATSSTVKFTGVLPRFLLTAGFSF